MMKMTFFKTCVFLGCMISMLEFSVGDKKTSNIKETDHFQISLSKTKKGELESAFKKGEMSMVKNFISEGVLEEYDHGIHDKNSLRKIRPKVDALSVLLKLRLVSIASHSYFTRHPSDKLYFNVTLIPGTALSLRLLVNMTAVQDPSLAIGGYAPLHHICTLPDVEPEIVKIFLDFGTVGINTWDESNSTTPLIEAVFAGNFDLVKFLIENGADINNSMTTSLDIYVRNNHQYDFMNIFTRQHVFISGVNVSISAVLAAAYENRPEVLRYLLENGGVVNEGEAWFYLLRPAHNGFTEVIEIVLKSGIDVNTMGPFGSTTLHRVAETGNTEMAKFLLMNGADPNMTNNFGWTPLHVAALMGNNNSMAMVELLLNSGCDVNALTDGGFSPLNLAEAGSDLCFLEFLVSNSDSLLFDKHRKLGESEPPKESAERLQFLLNHGAELDHQDDILGWTALHWAAANGDLLGAKLLVERYGAATDLKSKMGLTPFSTAKYYGREALSEYLKTGRNLEG